MSAVLDLYVFLTPMVVIIIISMLFKKYSILKEDMTREGWLKELRKAEHRKTAIQYILLYHLIWVYVIAVQYYREF